MARHAHRTAPRCSTNKEAYRPWEEGRMRLRRSGNTSKYARRPGVLHTALVNSQIRQTGYLTGRIITFLRLVKDLPSLIQAIANVVCLGAYCVLIMFQVSLAPTETQ